MDQTKNNWIVQLINVSSAPPSLIDVFTSPAYDCVSKRCFLSICFYVETWRINYFDKILFNSLLPFHVIVAYRCFLILTPVSYIDILIPSLMHINYQIDDII